MKFTNRSLPPVLDYREMSVTLQQINLKIHHNFMLQIVKSEGEFFTTILLLKLLLESFRFLVSYFAYLQTSSFTFQSGLVIKNSQMLFSSKSASDSNSKTYKEYKLSLLFIILIWLIFSYQNNCDCAEEVVGLRNFLSCLFS